MIFNNLWSFVRHRQVLLGALIVIVLISGGAGYALANHGKSKAATLSNRPVSNSSSANRGKKLDTKTTTGNSSVAVASSDSTNQAGVHTAATSTTSTTPKQPTPTPPPPVPSPPQPSITFSTDGCYVTASDAAGLILSGAVEYIDPTSGQPVKGGPLGDPNGATVPASGSFTEEIGLSGNSWQGWRVTAYLKDTTGNIVTSGVTYVTVPTCP